MEMSADDARAKIRLAVAAGQLQHAGRIEIGVSWVHSDIGPRNPDGTLHEFTA